MEMTHSLVCYSCVARSLVQKVMHEEKRGVELQNVRVDIYLSIQRLSPGDNFGAK